MLASSRLGNFVGTVLAIVGTILALVAYSGDRAYDLSYLGVAILGGVLIVAGVAILSVLRAALDKSGRKAASLRAGPSRESERVRVTVRCPKCDSVFSQTGTRPLSTRCPVCGATGTVGGG